VVRNFPRVSVGNSKQAVNVGHIWHTPKPSVAEAVVLLAFIKPRNRTIKELRVSRASSQHFLPFTPGVEERWQVALR